MTADDIMDDFDVFDNVESVSWQRRDLSGEVLATYTGVSALRENVQGSLAGLGPGQALTDRARWHVKASTLPVAPRRGDRLVAASGTWEVSADHAETWGVRLVVETLKVA